MKLIILSQNPIVQFKFGNGSVIQSHTLLGIWLIVHAGIKIGVYKIDPDWGCSFLVYDV